MKSGEINLVNDIYYTEKYADLYVGDNSSLFHFEYREGGSLFINLAIKSPIDKIGAINCDEGYYDLETPYGYGGFYTNDINVDFVGRAIEKRRERCHDENIIAEFIRFHPFNLFPHKFDKLFDMCIYDRNVAVVDLQLSHEERWKQYSGNTRNILRKCSKTHTFQPTENIEKFVNLYYETMKINEADKFYYFDTKYFHNLLNIDGVYLYEVVYEGKTIAMSFFMRTSEIAHYHLSANDTDYLKLNANYFILDNAFEEAIKWGSKYFLLGGGRTNDANDSLLKFKQKYSKITKPFYIAGMIYNHDKFWEYIHEWESHNEGKNRNYFLKYRLTSR
jgi:hypothetical protein